MTDVIVISSGGGGGPDRAMVGQIGHKLGRPNDGGSSGVKTLSIIGPTQLVPNLTHHSPVGSTTQLYRQNLIYLILFDLGLFE